MTPTPALSLSPHISLDEYRCHHCGALPPDFTPSNPGEPFRELFAAFEAIRKEWACPIQITSGYRCIVHNAAVSTRGAVGAHIFGLALDLGTSSPAEIIDLKNCARRVWPALRIGWREYITTKINCVHIDVGYLIYPRPSADFIRGAEW